MGKQKMILLTGPTAVGKTELSIALAKKYNGEIISADSMQVYRHMDIGTAKIRPEEMQSVPHYLIDCLEPDEEFHVMRFQQMAKEALKNIYAAGHLPIIVGGTGFYIQALLYDISFGEEDGAAKTRRKWEQYAKERGVDALHEELQKVDPKSAEKIHKNNVKRVVRALQFYEDFGKKISEHNEQEMQKTSPYDFRYFVLTNDRAVLYDRINRRVDQMIEDGLVEEVRRLKEMGYTKELVSMQGLGYKEILAYLDGQTTLNEAVAILKRDTRHFAKRQLTWFKRERDVIWLDKQIYPDTNALLAQIDTYLTE
ncbi:MAG: tRNA (adenosine(37)-N6)-dimethylallyltransferase MiaA [Lachnospiraceae bacterium]|nr:tRNA (adenosine(37)-N6)-dimethylallyltransferase MiaA [Lachnospiraceae bacterium]